MKLEIDEKRLIVPVSIKMISYGRAIRWMGWGLGESLMPIFILSFTDNFIAAAAIRSIYEFSILLTLPLMAIIGEKTSSKTLIIIALGLYPFIGIGYLFAGMFSLTWLIVITRSLNGVVYSMETVGVGIYFRRIVPKAKIGTAFGFFETLSNLGWIIAAMLSLFLIDKIPIYYLLFAITPTAIIALLFSKRAKNDLPTKQFRSQKVFNEPGYEIIKKLKLSLWVDVFKNGYHFILLILLTTILESFIFFYIPIVTYTSNYSLKAVVLVTIFATTPQLFFYGLGKFVDKKDKYNLTIMGLLIAVIMLLMMWTIQILIIKFIGAFVLGSVIVMFSIIIECGISEVAVGKELGAYVSTFKVVATIFEVITPVLIGFAVATAQINLLICSIVTGSFGLIFVFWQKKCILKIALKTN